MDVLDRSKAAAYLLFTALAWGAMFSIAKRALHAIDAFHLTALRYVPASLVMLGVLAAVEGPRALRADRAAFRLWLYGSLGFAGFSILGFLGLTHTTPEHTAIIVSLMPLVTALVVWLWRGQKPSTVTIVAIAVAFAGVSLVITHGRPHLDAGDWAADGLVLAGVVCWSIYTTGAATMPQFSPLRYTALSMALGTLTIVGATLAATFFGVTPPVRSQVAEFAPQIAYLAFVGGVAAVLAWNAGVGALGAATASLFINLVPIVAFGIAIAQGRRVGAIEIAGVLLTLGALVASNLATRPAPPRAALAALRGSARPVRSALRN
jgi:drug/metabolite transporter (DMT)-like permease